MIPLRRRGSRRGSSGRRARPVTLLVALVLLAAPASPAQESPPPQQVEVGVWLDDLHSIDLVDGSLGIEMYLWFISRDDSLRPFEVLQILNGRDWTARSIHQRTLPDGRCYTSAYLSATISYDWDLRYFPFDQQRPRIVIETPLPASELRLAPNPGQSVLSEFADAEGFRITDFRVAESVESYATDFGLRDEAGRRYSRLVIEVGLERESERLVVVLFIGLIVANLVALLTYAVHVSQLGIRTSMSSGAIFGAVGNMYILQRVVHPAAGSVLLDGVAIVTFGGIVVALLTGIVVDRIYRLERIRLARVVNWTVFAAVTLGSGGYLWWALKQAL